MGCGSNSDNMQKLLRQRTHCTLLGGSIAPLDSGTISLGHEKAEDRWQEAMCRRSPDMRHHSKCTRHPSRCSESGLRRLPAGSTADSPNPRPPGENFFCPNVAAKAALQQGINVTAVGVANATSNAFSSPVISSR